MKLSLVLALILGCMFGSCGKKTEARSCKCTEGKCEAKCGCCIQGGECKCGPGGCDCK